MIKAFDMFGTSQFTFYRSDEQYSTSTGGVVSLLVFGLLLSVFVGMTIDTFNYTNITVATETIYDTDPTPYKLTASAANNKFMFALGFTGGMNIAYQYFAFYLYHEAIDLSNGYSRVVTSIPLKRCNYSEWVGLSEKINNDFYHLGLDQLLCAPAGYQFTIQGKPQSPISKHISIIAKKCQKSQCPMGKRTFNNLNNTFPQFSLFYINANINPHLQNGIDYYIQDAVNFHLNPQRLHFGKIEFSQYTIQTDRSLMPWHQIQTLNGVMTKGSLSRTSQIFGLNSGSSIFLYLQIRKSSQRLKIRRSFQKLSYVLSFVGGLLNPILLVMCFLKFYNKFAFEVQFGHRIFKPNESPWFPQQSFNFFSFVKYGVYNLLAKVNLSPNWEEIQSYCQCRTEVAKQLDIYLLFRKLHFLEQACSTLLEDHHQIGLHLAPKPTIKQAKSKRKRYLMQDLIDSQIGELGSPQSLGQEQIQKQRQKILRLNPQKEMEEMQEKGEKQEKGENGEKQEKGEKTGTRSEKTMALQAQFAQNYKRLREESVNGCPFSAKIMKKLTPRKQDPSLISIDLSNHHHQKEQRTTKRQKQSPGISDQNLYTNSQLVRSSHPTL